MQQTKQLPSDFQMPLATEHIRVFWEEKCAAIIPAKSVTLEKRSQANAKTFWSNNPPSQPTTNPLATWSDSILYHSTSPTSCSRRRRLPPPHLLSPGKRSGYGAACDDKRTRWFAIKTLVLSARPDYWQKITVLLVSMITPVSAVSTRRHLRSAGQGDLVVPRTRTVGFGPQSFSVAGPSEWNSLSPEIKTTSLTLGQFSGRLKTEMYLRSYYESAAVIIFARDSIYAKRVYAIAIPSVCPSVRPSVTRADQSKTVEVKIMQFSPYSIAPSI